MRISQRSGKVAVPKAERSAKSGRQGERTDPKVEDAIYAALLDRPQMKSAALYREFEADPDLAPLLPGPRAFRGLVAGIREQLDRGRWLPTHMADDDARLVLEVVGAMRVAEKPLHDEIRRDLAEADGDESDLKYAAAAALNPYWPTPRVAVWIARLRRWVPGMTGAGDYVLPATWYAAREARGESTDDLDVEMAAVAASHWKKEQT